MLSKNDKRKELLPFVRTCNPVFVSGWIRVVHLFTFVCCPIIRLYVRSSVLLCPLCFLHKNDFRVVFTSSYLSESPCLIFVCLRIVVSYRYCVGLFVLFVVILCLVLTLLPLSPDCPFLIVFPVFSNFYL